MTSLGDKIVLVVDSSSLVISGTSTKVEVGGIEQSLNNGLFTYNGTEYALSYLANTDGGSSYRPLLPWKGGRGDRAGRLILEKEKPRKQLAYEVFKVVAGAGFEPAAFRL